MADLVSDEGLAGRLLFVMNTPTTGGAERHTFDLARALRAEGFTSTIFAMKAGSLDPGDTPLLQPDEPRSLPKRIVDLARAVRQARPGLVVAVNERPVFTSYLATRIGAGSVPIVGISHSTVLRNRREETMQRVYTPVFNRIDSVVFISENQSRYWRARGMHPRDAALILNGIDVAHFSPAARDASRGRTRESLGFAAEDFVVGMCAVLRPEKNHLQLLDALQALRASGTPARGLIVGDGIMGERLKARAGELGLSDHVRFVGMQGDVRPYVAAFDVGALCSTSIETLSLSALEVMAMGVPMVMSELGGASEIVDGRNGRLFPVGDLDGLVAGLAAFADPASRDEAGRHGRRTVEQRFDRRRMVSEYAAHFRRLTGRDTRRTIH